VDKENDRKVKNTDAKQWCKENGDMAYYETSAIENISVDNAFIEMAKMAIKRESLNQVFSLPESIGGASGAMKLSK
jgi:Ras-related protein Rab-7A